MDGLYGFVVPEEHDINFEKLKEFILTLDGTPGQIITDDWRADERRGSSFDAWVRDFGYGFGVDIGVGGLFQVFMDIMNFQVETEVNSAKEYFLGLKAPDNWILSQALKDLFRKNAKELLSCFTDKDVPVRWLGVYEEYTIESWKVGNEVQFDTFETCYNLEDAIALQLKHKTESNNIRINCKVLEEYGNRLVDQYFID